MVNELSSSIKRTEFLDWLSDYQILKNSCFMELITGEEVSGLQMNYMI
jgi:hypothetical protein